MCKVQGTDNISPSHRIPMIATHDHKHYDNAKKCAILVNLSTVVKITSKPLEHGKSMIKSNEIDCHGCSGINRGCNKP